MSLAGHQSPGGLAELARLERELLGRIDAASETLKRAGIRVLCANHAGVVGSLPPETHHA